MPYAYMTAERNGQIKPYALSPEPCGSLAASCQLPADYLLALILHLFPGK